ncbi:MAG: endonuclease/exonuclease/phosphatase family protein [Chloroflexi bacterium]|nr:endonuclease/exonuclease/phosphatase family protein [Chloroflexota bacterium]
MNYSEYPPRTAADIVRIRRRLQRAGVPPKVTDKNIIIATWNIRMFGDVYPSFEENPHYPKRNLRAIAIIAEIISHFDVVAIQEVRRDVTGLRTLLEFLGPHWGVILSDVNEGHAGNAERLAFVYDKRRVDPSGLAGELVLPPEWGTRALQQFARTPYAVSFRAGDIAFILVTVHIRYGSGNPNERLPELEAFAEWMARWSRREDRYHEDLIVLGDFNIDRRGDPRFEAFTSRGLNVPPQIRGISTNLATGKKAKHYDQIGWFMGQLHMEFTGRAGSVDFAGAVFKELSLRNMSYRVSDHLPLWVEFSTDRSNEQLIHVLQLDELAPDPLAQVPD